MSCDANKGATKAIHSIYTQCECEWHGLEKGDVLYVYSSWDGGIEFDSIKNIQYCPVCGRELPLL